ncbi:MAG: hypothetical protein ACRDMJ_11590 [Solirubrobacteraceae bacterium]
MTIVQSAGHPTLGTALAAADVPRTTVNEALSRLRAAGHVAVTGDAWELVDPLLELSIGRDRPDA